MLSRLLVLLVLNSQIFAIGLISTSGRTLYVMRISDRDPGLHSSFILLTTTLLILLRTGSKV